MTSPNLTVRSQVCAKSNPSRTTLGLRALELGDKSDVPSRSEQRYIDETAKIVTQALCEYVVPAMDLNRPDERTWYDDTVFLNVIVPRSDRY